MVTDNLNCKRDCLVLLKVGKTDFRLFPTALSSWALKMSKDGNCTTALGN